MAGAMVAALVLTLMWAVIAGQGSRTSREQLLQPAHDMGATVTFRFETRVDNYDGHRVTAVMVAGVPGEAPARPPGVARFPRPGEVFVSPALAHLMATDPEFARRFPGRGAGTVAEAGLASPDEIVAVAGLPDTELAGGLSANRWNGYGGQFEQPLIPQRGLVSTVLALVGLPLLFFGFVVARLSANERRRRAAVLNLIGVPAGVLARAARIEAGAHAFAGALAGLASGAALVPWLAQAGVFGFTWFGSDTPITPGLAISALVVLPLAVGGAASWGTRRQLREVVATRHAPAGGNRGPLPFVPFAVGTMILGTIWVFGNADTGLLLNSPTVLLLGGAGLVLAVAGVLWVTAPLLRRVARRIQGSERPGVMLAGRRLMHDASIEVMSAVGILLVLVTGVFGVGILTYMKGVEPVVTRQTFLTVSSLRSDGARAALTAGAQAYALQPLPAPGTPSDALIASCSDLVTLLRAEGTSAADAVKEQCVDGRTYTVVDAATHASNGPPDSRHTDGPLLVPVLGQTMLSGTMFLTTNPPGNYQDGMAKGLLTALVNSADVDRFTTVVESADPLASVSTPTQNDSITAQYPIIRSIIVNNIVFGALVSLAAFLLAAVDRARARRRQATSLLILGTPRRVLAAAVTVGSAGRHRSHVFTPARRTRQGPGGLTW
ncbi:hypothetical protein [Actinacidiphila soli]|uniref:hypothetical protein n=1 Tax=Actinacidiphila soli TaxID=2487275 RepID=UPI000FCCD2BC|nr:hypothetical protein [Actinacidiphila soli]